MDKSIKQERQKKERPPKIDDLVGKRVRITYYHRDVKNISGNKGPGDMDEVVEGIVRRVTHRSEGKFCFNGSVSVCGCVETDEGKTRFAFLPLDGPYSCSGYIGNFPSELDGKRNGSYDIELLGEK